MKFEQLLKVASDAYSDGLIEQFWDEKKQRIVSHAKWIEVGDDLAGFIAVELHETFEAEASDEKQLAKAVCVMEQAETQIGRVRAAFDNVLNPVFTLEPVRK